MIKSMTAFGRGKADGDRVSLTVEIKSVNSRFLDCSVKLPRQYLYLEERIKSFVQKSATTRGKVDVYITLDTHASEVGSITVDLELAAKYISALRSLGEAFSLKDDISIMTVARNQELFRAERPDEDADGDFELILSALAPAVESFVSMREAEGERIRLDITEKLEHIRELSAEVEAISLTDTVGYRDKLEARLRRILSDENIEVDENRLLTECAIFCDKIAIDEELVRLRSHFDAFYDILSLPEPSGRKLDFLVQELNRETNTIGSKCNNAKIARIVVDMKGEIEKIREQIQNIE